MPRTRQDPESPPLLVYDIDGTITLPGRDLWLLATGTLARDAGAFGRSVEEWKASIAEGADPYQASLLMMQRGLELMEEKTDGARVRALSRTLTERLFDEGRIYQGALEHLGRASAKGAAIVLSTTNYQEGGEGFLDVLVSRGILDTQTARVSGSLTRWEHRQSVHFNMDEGKIEGLCRKLGLAGRESLQALRPCCFGDDPEGNDRGILSLSDRAYVIASTKNLHAALAPNMRRATWEEILEEGRC